MVEERERGWLGEEREEGATREGREQGRGVDVEDDWNS